MTVRKMLAVFGATLLLITGASLGAATPEESCEDAAAAESLKTHTEIAIRIGVTGTPLFLIDGQVVGGANIPLMEKILDGKK